MRIDEITKLLKRTPFEPFSVYMSDGSVYPVKHPDQVILTSRAAYIGIGNGRRIAQDVVICDLVHITQLGPAAASRRRRGR